MRIKDSTSKDIAADNAAFRAAFDQELQVATTGAEMDNAFDAALETVLGLHQF